MTSLVIGTGFVGQGIIQRLVRDHHVILTYGQLDDLDGLAVMLAAHSPSVVVLAAGSPLHDGFCLDRRTINDHVMVAERVATYARKADARVIYVSSTLVLPPVRTGYGALKLSVEYIVAGPKTVVLRSGTVVHDLYDRNQSVLHRFVRAASRDLPLPVYDKSVGQKVYFVTRDQLAEEVARSLSGSGLRGSPIVAAWEGTVSDLARLVTTRWLRITGEMDMAPCSEERLLAGYSIIPTIDAMLMQARTE